MTWTPVTPQSETWTADEPDPPRVFSPLVFSIWPFFATGVSSDFWTATSTQSETWTSV